MYIPRPCQQPTVDNTKEIMPDEDRFFAYCTKFKFLGTSFTPELNDSNDIQTQIDQAIKAFYAMNKNMFRNKEISSTLYDSELTTPSSSTCSFGVAKAGRR
jgi:hypothetical protein